MPVQRVVIEAHLRVERQQVAIASHHQRVDLDEAGIKLAERLIQPTKEFRELLRGGAREAHHAGKPPRMMGLQSGRRVDRHGQDLVRLVAATLQCPCHPRWRR